MSAPWTRSWPRTPKPAIAASMLGMFLFLAAGLALLVAGFGALIAAPLELVIGASTLGGLGLGVVLAVLAFGGVLSALPYRASADRRGVRLGRLGLRRIPVRAITAVRLRARPGGPIRVSVQPSDDVVFEDADLEAQGFVEFGLDPHRAQAAAVADALGVPWEEDTGPPEAWEGHRVQAVQDRRMNLEIVRARSLQQYADLHAVPALEPMCEWGPADVRIQMVAHDGLGLRGVGDVRIDRTHVRSAGVEAELLAIEQVFVEYRMDASSVLRGSVFLEVDGRLWEVARTAIPRSRAETLEAAGNLKWIAETLTRLAWQARPVEQGAPDVPEALRRMTAAARARQGA